MPKISSSSDFHQIKRFYQNIKSHICLKFNEVFHTRPIYLIIMVYAVRVLMIVSYSFLFFSDPRLLHWSNLVGASHSKEYMIWQYGAYSSKGVKEVCEYGYPRTLEQEMRQHVRLLIHGSNFCMIVNHIPVI